MSQLLIDVLAVVVIGGLVALIYIAVLSSLPGEVALMPTTLVCNRNIRKGHCIVTAENGKFVYSGSLREGFKRLEDNGSEVQISPEDFDRIAAEEVLKRMN